jgi:hypothetical protein
LNPFQVVARVHAVVALENETIKQHSHHEVTQFMKVAGVYFPMLSSFQINIQNYSITKRKEIIKQRFYLKYKILVIEKKPYPKFEIYLRRKFPIVFTVGD